MVEQYNCYGSDIRGGEMRPEEDGQWVRYSDYAALEAQLAERVKVKPLEWSKDSSVGGHGGWIGRAGDFTRAVKIGWMVEMPYEFGKQAFATLDAAKAAAQADYERRILAALEATPPAPKDPWPAHYANTTAPGRFTPPAPKVTATHRHKKRGSEYSVLGQAQVQCSDCLTDYEVVTVYVGTDGQMWVRRKSEFEDGRFETLTAAQEAGKP